MSDDLSVAPAPTETMTFRRALLATALVFGCASWIGWSDHAAVRTWLASVGPAVCLLGWARRRGVLRSRSLVLAAVAWLVAGVLLQLTFPGGPSAAPLVAMLLVLLAQFVAQLLVDLRAFANAGARTPPVTYPVTFALAVALAVSAELFREARTSYPPTTGAALCVALAASFFLLVALWWDWARKAFASLTMAVTLLSLIALGSVAGTIVIQHSPEDAAGAHFDKFMNAEGAAPVNARYLFRDPAIEWTAEDEARRVTMNDAFGPGMGDRWAELVRRGRAKDVIADEGRAFVAENREALRAFHDFAERTHATRIFKSWYFNALLVLLGCTVVGVMVRRFPYGLRDAGWVAAHAGIVGTLVCLAGSDLCVRDGFIRLAPTASPGAGDVPSDARAFDDVYDAGRSRRLPFALRLVRTSADWYQELVVEVAGADGGVTSNHNYPLLPGRTIELLRPAPGAPPRYRIEMLECVDRARTTRVGFRTGTSSGVSALQLLLDPSGARDRWVTDEDDTPLGLPGARLRVILAKTDEEAAAALRPRIPADTGAAGFVRVLVDGKDLARIPATAGRRAEVVAGGRTWQVAVTETTLDVGLSLQERSLVPGERTPLERQVPGIGGATLSVSADGVEPQRASAFSQEASGDGHAGMAVPVLKDAGLSFELDFVVPAEVRLVVKPDGSIVCAQEERGAVTAPTTLRRGDALPGRGASLAVGALVRDAELDVELEPLLPESDADYMRSGIAGVNEPPGRPAVRVRITEPGCEPYEQWVIGGDPWMRTPVSQSRDRRLRIVLAAAAESMYRSAVQAIDADGNVLGEHVIRVNSPFRLAGYTVYQNQFVRPDQGGPLSVVRVRYDPFVPFLYAAFALVSAGVIALLWFPGQRAFKLHAHLAGISEEGPVK